MGNGTVIVATYLSLGDGIDAFYAGRATVVLLLSPGRSGPGVAVGNQGTGTD